MHIGSVADLRFFSDPDPGKTIGAVFQIHEIGQQQRTKYQYKIFQLLFLNNKDKREYFCFVLIEDTFTIYM